MSSAQNTSRWECSARTLVDALSRVGPPCTDICEEGGHRLRLVRGGQARLTCQLCRVGRDVLDLRPGDGSIRNIGDEEDEGDEEEREREAKRARWSVAHHGRVCESSTVSAKDQSVIRR